MLASLYTVLKNVSGAARHFSYLSAHGADLASNAQVSEPGCIVTRLAAEGRMRGGGRRRFLALENDLDAGRIAIVRSPLLHLYDATDAVTRQFVIDDGIMGTVAADWA